IGSSSVKAAILDGTNVVPGTLVTASFRTRRDGDTAEVDPDELEGAVRDVAERLKWDGVRTLGLTGMGPAWLAMDERGNALTPIITHQDRRSLQAALELENAVGRDEILAITGNRPTPGGISSTLIKHFGRNSRPANSYGHVMTWLVRKFGGPNIIDPSNAGFTGLLDVRQPGWRWADEVLGVLGITPSMLPEIRAGDSVVATTGENDLNVPAGLTIVGGFVDGSGPLLLAGAKPGQLVHSAGSTDVLAIALTKPMPRDGLLCRPLGTDGFPSRWVSAATHAAGGDAIRWVKDILFPAEPFEAFADRLPMLATRKTAVVFDPALAGDRQAVQQPAAAWRNLTLATSRDDLAAAVVQGVIRNHLDRLDRILKLATDAGVDVLPEVVTTGGGSVLAALMHDR
ncbi:MAG: FGGY family carbohydrate kinase, partial [Planctomycetota bacterium]